MERNKFNPEKHIKKPVERIDNGVWRPVIFDDYSDRMAAGASTKELTLGYKQENVLRLLGSPDRFEAPIKERLRAGRVLAKVRDELDPDVDTHHIVKSKLEFTGNVKVIDADWVSDLEKGNLAEKSKLLKGIDGMITDQPGYPLYIPAADCAPIGLYDPEHNAIGAFHTGFYGVAEGIIENGLNLMKETYKTDPKKVVLVIGPGIHDYEVGVAMKDSFIERYGENATEFVRESAEEGKYIINLPGAIKQKYMDLGVPEDNISVSEYDTTKSTDVFPSDRQERNDGVDREKIDRFGFMITLKKQA